MSDLIDEFDNPRCAALSKRANIERPFARIDSRSPDNASLKSGP
jgi:hypothetical protein